MSDLVSLLRGDKSSKTSVELLNKAFSQSNPASIPMPPELSSMSSLEAYLTVVQRLNRRWDLGLPELLVVERSISSLDDEEKPLQHKCAKYIEYLSGRTESCLSRLLDDFDDSAKAKFFGWLPKPSQERGTLQVLPVWKSFVNRDLVSKNDVAPTASAGAFNEHRITLLTLLQRLLAEEKKLARDSEVYSRSDRPAFPVSIFQPSISYPGVCPKRQRLEKMAGPRTNKRRKHEDKQALIKSWLRPASPYTPLPALSMSNPNISYASTNSPPPADIFTPVSEDGQTSSNDTLITQDEAPITTQYGLSTQDFHSLIDESLLGASGTIESAMLCRSQRYFRELLEYGPFREPRKDEVILQPIPFRYRYECHRLAQKVSISAHQFFTKIIEKCKSEQPSYDLFWEAAKSICNTSEATKIVAGDKSSPRAWENAEGAFGIPSEGKSVVLSGAVDWSDRKQLGIFCCKLNPLRMEKSCRLERIFGADRFMYLTIPQFAPNSVPNDSRGFSSSFDDLYSALVQWLGCRSHYIAGRYWRAFFVEPVKAKSNDKRPRYSKLCMFAVDGEDFSPLHTGTTQVGEERSEARSPMAIEQFTDSYMPIASNLDMSDKKAFQRFALGLSRSLPTVEIYQSEFVYLPDNQAWPRTMNDGCARMSRVLANAIAQVLGLPRTPSVFQARVSGAKGLWMVEDEVELYPKASEKRGYWLEITASQLKIKPHPMDRDAHPEHRTFEVLKWTSTPRVASMNIQLMGILSHGRVPTALLESRLRANTHGYYEALKIAMSDPAQLLFWMHRNEKGSRETEPEMLGSFPRDRTAQINFLLAAGFSVKDNETIRTRLKHCLTAYLDRYVERLQIRVENSTSIWCVPDPYGVLKKGEIQLNFSHPWEGPNGNQFSTLHGLECIVFRSPGYLPSDAQRVRGVWRPELQHLYDVVIFSTQGQVPLAHKLSGGDYDGDTCWVCFDQEIVKSFDNTNYNLSSLKAEECGLEDKSILLSNIFSSQMPTSSEIDDFFTECFSFNLAVPKLGVCSKEHERVAYHRGYDDDGAIALAALVGHLVDAPKQGHVLSKEAWTTFKNKNSGSKMLPDPAYRNPENKPKDESVVDHLKLIVAAQEKTNILSDFEVAWPEGGRYDRTLSMPWNDALTKYEKNRKNKRTKTPSPSDVSDDKSRIKERERQVGDNIIQKLKRDVDGIKELFRDDLTRYCNDEIRFEKTVWQIHEKLQSVEPLADQDHEICRRFKDEEKQEFSSWSLLRASCLHSRWAKSMGPWYAAGRELAKIKADATGRTGIVTAKMLSLLKPDGKLISRIADREREELDDMMDWDCWGEGDI